MTATAAKHGGLSVRDIRVGYGGTPVLSGIDLDVAPGEALVLFGPSGIGKTVLLRAIAGLEPAASGQVLVGGRDVTNLGPESRGIGVAFQNFALYPHMAARDNIASPLQARRLPKAEIDDRVERIASMLRIGHVLGNLPRALSNGQKQRTALARALVAEPAVLLLDDPLRNVDAKLRYEMRMELPRLLRRLGAASIYVTQDHREAMALGDRVAVLSDGRIVQCDAPEAVYDAPATAGVARLFGDPPLNLVPAELRPDGVSALGLRFPLRPVAVPGDASGGGFLLGLRPEALEVLDAPAAGAAPATVLATTPLHERQVLLLRTAGGQEALASTAGTPPASGSVVWLRADPARVLLYDADTGTRLHAAAAEREFA